MTHGHLGPIDTAECWELLGVRTVGFVAFVNHEGQQLVPVNYVLHGRTIMFRTSEHSLLASLAEEVHDVAFIVAYTADLEPRGWNVTVHGSTAAVSIEEYEGRLPRTWAGGQRDVLIGLEPARIDGRRVAVR